MDRGGQRLPRGLVEVSIDAFVWCPSRTVVCSFSPEAKMRTELAQQSCQNSTISISETKKQGPESTADPPKAF